MASLLTVLILRMQGRLAPSHRHVGLRGFGTALAVLGPRHELVARAELVRAAGLHVLLEGARLAFELVNGLLLLGERLLHLTKHFTLKLLEAPDICLGLVLVEIVFHLLFDSGLRGHRVVVLTVSAGLTVLLLASVVLIREVLHFLEMVGFAFLAEHVVVGFQEVVQVVGAVHVVREHLVAVRLDVRDRLVAPPRVRLILSVNAVHLGLVRRSLVSVVLLFACTHVVCELRVLVGDADLHLKAPFLLGEFTNTVFDEHTFGLLLLQHHLFLKLARGLHVSDELFIFGREGIDWEAAESQEVPRELLLRNLPPTTTYKTLDDWSTYPALSGSVSLKPLVLKLRALRMGCY